MKCMHISRDGDYSPEWGLGVKCHMEPFRKFISFGTVSRPLLKPSRSNKLPLTFVIPMTPHVQCKTRKMVTIYVNCFTYIYCQVQDLN